MPDCPLCGADLSETVEHYCATALVEEPAHVHAFGRDGADCHCGVTLADALVAAAEAAKHPSRPSASTACTRCWSPITSEQRRDSGLCADCLAVAATETPSPTLVVHVDARRLYGCPTCTTWFTDPALLDTHVLRAHGGEEATEETERIVEAIRAGTEILESHPDPTVLVTVARTIAAQATRLVGVLAATEEP